MGTQQAVSEEIAQECIGDVIEYGQDRYIINVTGKLEGVIIKKDIIIDGTFRNKKLFYDAVISMASVWIPEMPVKEFETIMMQKFETRTKSIHYVKEANKDLVFIKYKKNAEISCKKSSLLTIYFLQKSLDFNSGSDLAKNLFRLYEFCRTTLLEKGIIKVEVKLK